MTIAFGQRRRKQPSSGVEIESKISADIARHHPDQLVDQMAIYLEESPPAYPILVLLGAISDCRRAELRQRLRIHGSFVFEPPPRGKKRRPPNFRQLARQRLRPAHQIHLAGLSSAKGPSQQILIRRVREQL